MTLIKTIGLWLLLVGIILLFVALIGNLVFKNVADDGNEEKEDNGR